MTTIRITVSTHRGKKREGNEDCVGLDGWSLRGTQPASVTIDVELDRVRTVVVCDGMGGHAGGAEASAMACELLTEPGAIDGESPEQLTATTRLRLQAVSDAINDRAQHQPELAGMGCTVVGVVLDPSGRALVFNVGDSRCYRLEGDYLSQLSVDHRHLGGNVLHQAIGGGVRMILEPDFFDCRLPAGVGLVLCTDGLDDYASASDIEALLVSAPPRLPTQLTELALAGGGGDNVTVVQIETIAAPSDTHADHPVQGEKSWPR
ncbi:PP2C family protein-serine/threonine phosphatase [Nocardia sp. NPDC058705]|uniref:PP2C family protein-serine/threonine phosphatase n=1 Tax=Nocardia sp. NPDC058705 TaxID=3346609 RepID=UPI0036A4F21E